MEAIGEEKADAVLESFKQASIEGTAAATVGNIVGGAGQIVTWEGAKAGLPGVRLVIRDGDACAMQGLKMLFQCHFCTSDYVDIHELIACWGIAA